MTESDKETISKVFELLLTSFLIRIRETEKLKRYQ